ncbi:MAG: hypothetical protein KJS68_13560, partial [Alphaproteobacteria bacterium]|nr:hypothetical protein [Alphaproteobacteria bacterium]
MPKHTLVQGLRIVFALLFALTVAHAKESGTAISSSLYVVRYDHWSNDDERDYRRFIQALGESSCDTVNACLHSEANPFRASDPPDHVFAADCADLPYVLRFYYAWKRGLPFSYAAAVAPVGAVGGDGDIRYSRHGNHVVSRIDVPGGVMSGYTIIDQIRAAVSSATYRIHPDAEEPFEQDFYSPMINPASIRAGTVIYDPAGHLAIVFRVGPDGRIYFFDAHTDYSLTQMTYDLRFARARPADGAGFKNWRPIRLVGATRQADGTLTGGHIVVATNKDIADFSDEQYFGNGKRPADENWAQGAFTLNGERLDYYDYVRAQLAGGQLMFDPVAEVGDMAASICSNLQYRVQAVDRALAAGMARKPEPDRLPPNIYGTEGDWETYSTPSRDARLKTAFKALRDEAQRFVTMRKHEDATRHLFYFGTDLVGDMLAAYDQATSQCRIAYTRSDGSKITMSYEQARERLFAMSFDPYQCPELRWGATDPVELSTCPDGPVKRAWYAAEQDLRNQLERTYDARMDFTLDELRAPGPGKGALSPPDTDVRAYLQS